MTPSRPFLHSGVDYYAGPFSLKTIRGRGAKVCKGYLILLVCLVTSAVHLEMSTDYTTAGFIQAYRRFTGRRGLCASVHGDCAPIWLVLMPNYAGCSVKPLRNLQNCDLLASDYTVWN